MEYANKYLNSQERVLDICIKAQADNYINMIGGQELYSKETFLEKGVVLNFIKSNTIEYKQYNDKFVPWLSIIDVLMFNSKEEVKELLNQFELIK